MSAFGKSLLKFKVRVSVLSPSLKVAKKKQKFEWHRNLTMNLRALTETEYQDENTRRTADTSGSSSLLHNKVTNFIVTPHSSRSLWYFALGSVRPPPEEFENARFSSTVRRTVHTNPSRKRSFSKTLFKRKNLKTLALRFPVDLVPTVLSLLPSREEKRGPWERGCGKRWRLDNHTCIPDRVFLKHKSKMTGDWCVFNFSWVVWTGPITHLSQDPLEHPAREQNNEKQSHTLYHSCLRTHLTQSPGELQSHHGQLQTSGRTSWLESLGRGFPNPL